jgi:suppressor of ftsI
MLTSLSACRHPESQPSSLASVTYQHWRIVNETAELHPFHIHQVHFLAYAQNGVPLPDPAWLDTVNVPYGGYVDLILDLTDPIIRGMSLFHCHLLNHEEGRGISMRSIWQHNCICAVG